MGLSAWSRGTLLFTETHPEPLCYVWDHLYRGLNLALFPRPGVPPIIVGATADICKFRSLTYICLLSIPYFDDLHHESPCHAPHGDDIFHDSTRTFSRRRRIETSQNSNFSATKSSALQLRIRLLHPKSIPARETRSYNRASR